MKRKRVLMNRPRLNGVCRTTLFPKLAVFGTAVESLVQYVVPLSFLLDFGKHGTPTISALDNPSEDVVISA